MGISEDRIISNAMLRSNLPSFRAIEGIGISSFKKFAQGSKKKQFGLANLH
jgi:hypothetical protein